MNHRKTLQTLSELEAVLDQKLFAAPSKDGEERDRSHRNTATVAKAGAGGAVVIGTGGAVRHVLRSHYGAAEGGYKEAGRNAARDVGERAKRAGSAVRNSNAGRAVETAGRHAENAAATGAAKIKGMFGNKTAVKKGGGMVGRSGAKSAAKKALKKLSNPLARRLVALSAQMEEAGY